MSLFAQARVRVG